MVGGHGPARPLAVAIVAVMVATVAGCARDGAVESASQATTGSGPAGRGADAAASPVAAGGRHVVLPGETLSRLAERYGVPMADLARANRIERPYGLHAGQVLTIPGGRGGRPERDTVAKTYKVRPGETLAGIAARNGLRLGDIVAANPGLDPDRVRAGQLVRIPGEVAMPSAPLMTAEEIELVRRASKTKPPSLSGDGFAWPLRGKVLSRFGEKPDGTRNDGVNIAAAAGSPVLAAENGVVVYAGDKLAGYGETLLVRHAGGFTTAYAHNQKLLVRLGEPVRRGQRIATVGATGGVRQPQLHFELRAGSSPIDPQLYLDGPGAKDRAEVAARGR